MATGKKMWHLMIAFQDLTVLSLDPPSPELLPELVWDIDSSAASLTVLTEEFSFLGSSPWKSNFAFPTRHCSHVFQ